jgi:L-Ala-D/L-Glu epimerase
VKVALHDGSSGVGECPTSSAFRDETAPVMRALLRGWAPGFIGTPAGEWRERIARLRRDNEAYPMALSGLETALFRADLMATGISEHSYWGGKSKGIETDITIPFIPGNPNLPRWIDYAVRKGFRTYKIKVGGDTTQDRQFVSSLCHALSERVPDFRVRLDGNQGYTSSSFLRMVEFLEKTGYKIELFEQPLPRNDYRGLAEAKRCSSIPVILDEAVMTGEQMMKAVDMDLCHGVNIKIAKSGIQESMSIMRIARESGLKLMIGCMTETMVGLSAGVYMAAGSEAFDYVDLDGIYFLRHRNKYGALEIDGPRFTVD